MFIKAIALIAAATSIAAAQNSFTYQGRLDDAGVPADGNYDMRFTLWDDPFLGAPDTQIGSTVTSPFMPIADGLFSINLDLDDEAFQSSSLRYLQVEVRFAGDPAYTILDRQRINYTPRSMYAIEAGAAQGLKFPFVANGGDSDLSPAGVLFRVNNFGTTGTAIRGDGKTSGVVGVVSDFNVIQGTPLGSGIIGISRNMGVYGGAQDGHGVRGHSINGTAGYFETSNSGPLQYALRAQTSFGASAGLFETNQSSSTNPTLVARSNSTQASAYAVHAIIESTNAGANSAALRGENRGNGPFGIGVYGSHDGTGWGVYGKSGPGGLAGFFNGDVTINGTLIKSGGSFKIDHPQDPANRYLSHSFVESPDMKNIYDGVITLGANGQAVVVLPTYFEALNQEFRYQLTCVGGYAPVYISSEIANQAFVIAGGREGLKVSWQVTGVRHDAWADQNRIVVEEEKSSEDQGRYLNPEAFGKSKEDGVGYQKAQQGVQAQN